MGAAIRRIRQEHKPRITLEDLSGRLAVRGLYLDRTALSRIENGERAVFDFEVLAIAAALRVPLTELYRNDAR